MNTPASDCGRDTTTPPIPFPTPGGDDMDMTPPEYTPHPTTDVTDSLTPFPTPGKEDDIVSTPSHGAQQMYIKGRTHGC